MNRASTNLQATIFGFAVVAVLGGVLWFGLGPQTEPPVPIPVELSTIVEQSVSVHVSGAVMRPGIVTVGPHSRVADVIAAAGGASSVADLSAINLAARVRDGEYIVIPDFFVDKVSRALPTADGIDLNAATATELEDLPGVGPVLAERIVGYRDLNGPFAAVEDLLDVPGIGEAKLAAMRDDIALP